MDDQGIKNRESESNGDRTMDAKRSVLRERLEMFCRKNRIRRLGIFGSALREDFGPDSDVNVPVEFRADRIAGVLGMARMERELSLLFGGRKVNLRAPEDLSRYFRQSVIEEAEVQYVEEWRYTLAPYTGCG